MVALRRLPSVDALLHCPRGSQCVSQFGRAETVFSLRAILGAFRKNSETLVDIDVDVIYDRAERLMASRQKLSQQRVFNLSGTVLHTNLGRAVMPEAAIAAVTEAMRYPTALEYAVNDGQRGERDDHVRALICELTGAEDACLVNNNAAAVLLVLASLAKKKDTLVSRGELIEIGGSFRLPEIMRRADTRLVEVGATNRTHLADFETALSDKTGLILKAHTSNYAILGFTAAVAAPALSALARKHSIPFFDDLGSGTLVDLSRYGLPMERSVQQALKEGADIVSFSGDKLLGGPQCGFIVGRRDLVRICAKNHLKRALRLDKLRLAALEATLKLYRDPDRLAETLPTLKFFNRKATQIREQAARVAPVWRRFVGPDWDTGVTNCASQIGSGAMPLDTLPSAALFAKPAAKQRGRLLEQLAARLRQLSIPVIGRIHDDQLLLDLRCLDDEAGFLNVLSGDDR